MLKLAVFLAALATLSVSVNAKVFSLCELVRELRKQGFPEQELRDWACLVERESSMKTQAIGPPNSDQSQDYGLFQINNRYWCSDGKTPGKECNITCKQLLTDDITIASKCAKKIFGVHGFSAWNAWKDHCQGALPDISHCN